MIEYRNDLERQINEKKKKHDAMANRDKPDEELLKAQLLTQIHELDLKKRVLADQLNKTLTTH